MTTANSHTVFSIEGKVLKLNTAQDVQKYVDKIMTMQELTEIKLSGNTVGVEAAKALAAAIQHHKTLKVANLSDMFTGRLKSEIPLALEAFVDALEQQPHLVEIDLSDNAFGPAGAAPLTRLLKNNRNIQVIKLNNNGLGIGGGEFIANALKEAADLNDKEGKPSSLKTVVIGRNRLESQGASYLAKAFERHTTITHLRMPQNSIRPEGIKALLESLEKCQDLKQLDLQDNTFTLVGSQACAKALSVWKNITDLNIGECLLGAQGSIEIMKALTGTHSQLETLLLSYNEMNEAGAALVSEMLQGKQELKKLELNGNAFDAEGPNCQAIQDVLRSMDKEDILDELDDMEEPSEEEEEPSEEEEEKEEKDDSKKEKESGVDELAELMTSKLNV